MSAKASLSISFPVLFPSHVHTIIDPNNRCWTTGSLESTSPENDVYCVDKGSYTLLSSGKFLSEEFYNMAQTHKRIKTAKKNVKDRK